MKAPSVLWNLVIPNEDEHAVGLWRAVVNYLSPMQRLGTGTFDAVSAGDKMEGLILLTNQRVFIFKRAFLTGSISLWESFRITQIAGVSAHPGFTFRGISLNVSSNGQSRRIDLGAMYDIDCMTMNKSGKPNLDSIVTTFRRAIADDIKHSEEKARRARVQVVLDFSFLKAEMEKSGILIETIKCPNCSASVSLPAMGTSVKCDYCNSIIYAHNVFDKMKGFIKSV